VNVLQDINLNYYEDQLIMEDKSVRIFCLLSRLSYISVELHIGYEIAPNGVM
jgi:hypothetical protein